MERLKEEAKQEESKSGRREVEREGRRVEIKRMCENQVSSQFTEDHSPMAEWEGEGFLGVFGVCVCGVFVCDCCACGASLPSIVSGFGENILSDTDYEFVQSQTFSLSPKNVTRFLLKSRRDEYQRNT